jgi:hypothetical protein
MPLDIGWYYGYDPNATLDQYEYILGATIAYSSSMSYQVSPAAAARHPFTGPLLDLIRQYEALRLSGRVPEEMKARLRVSPELAGVKTSEQRERLLDHRREYCLVEHDGHQAFQRVVYEPWHELGAGVEKSIAWTVNVRQGPAHVGVWIHARGPVDLNDPWVEVGGRRFEWRGSVRPGQYLTLAASGPITLYGPPLKEPQTQSGKTNQTPLPIGQYKARFGCRDSTRADVRVRVELQPPEVHEIPDPGK